MSGGGFLFHDKVQEVYAGVMQLSLKERITVKAFGLIATKMPDGSKGFSLIVFITAEDFQPIPIGMGATLQGIGGMIAINRTFNEEAMRAGLRNKTLATLLFPQDPIRNAPEIIRNLITTFPAEEGCYLIGVLMKTNDDRWTVNAKEIDEFARLTAGSPDPWMQLLGLEQQAQLALKQEDYTRAEAILLRAQQRCTPQAPAFRCITISKLLGDLYATPPDIIAEVRAIITPGAK